MDKATKRLIGDGIKAAVSVATAIAISVLQIKTNKKKK